MSFTRDYSILLPVDHTLNAQWPNYGRNVKQDVQDRLADIISGFNSGETIKGVLNLPFIVNTTPVTVTDQIQLYGKVVAGKTELHTLNEDGVENQITSGGALNLTAAALMALVGPLLYPIGKIVTLGVSTNPNTLFGFGTWTAIAGKVIVGISGSDTEFDVLDETGGEKTHTLTADENGPHTHTYNNPSGASAGSQPGSGNTFSIPSANTGSSGLGTPHNNLQPYIVKYVWQRTA